MGLFEQFPYTNFHELNLTWFLDTFRELLNAWEDQQREFADLKEAWEELQQFVTDYFDNLDVQQEINHKLNSMMLDGSLAVILAPFIPDAVSNWLENNLDPSSPPVDASLSIAGAAADSKVTGELRDMVVAEAIGQYGTKTLTPLHTGGYIYKTDGKSVVSTNWTYTEFFPVRSKALLFTCPESDNQNALDNVAAVAFYTSADADDYMSAETIDLIEGTTGVMRWTGILIPAGATHYRVSILTANYTDYKIVEVQENAELLSMIEVLNENVGRYEYTYTFTAASQNKVSDIEVKAGKTYRIYPVDHNDSGNINIYSNGSGGSLKYVRVNDETIYVDFNCEVDGYLCAYNTGGFIGDLDVVVLEGPSRAADNDPVEYWVSKQPTINSHNQFKVPDESSFTAMLLKLKDDSRPKIIYVEEGEYDIFQEYADLRTAGLLPDVPQSDYDPSTEYVPYNVFIPTNTHIIGIGYVTLTYMPDAADTNVNESKTISPVNVAGSMTLENIEIHCKNGRYAIHDDPIQNRIYNGSIKKYINVKAIKYESDRLDGNLLGYRHCFGCGLPRSHSYTFENCWFEAQDTDMQTRTFYFHDRGTVGGVTMIDSMSSRITCSHCVFMCANDGGIGVFLGNIGVGLDIRVWLNECWTNGVILSCDSNDPTAGTKANSYNIVSFWSACDQLIVRDPNNPYPPVFFD